MPDDKKPDSPFAALAALRDKVPAGKVPAAKEPKGPARAVVRYERKGRGGREATVIEKLALPPAELERWCKDLKRALGCGGAVEGDAIVLQGDLRSRLEPILTGYGVRAVTIAR